ncbi:MAG: phosphatidylserine synthase [Treponema sp.]|nr:phosphatidylserine synthase [Treponema sp.]
MKKTEVKDLEKTKILIGYYGFWVVLTYINAAAGLTGIYFALTGNIRYALISLMAAGLCDGFDGRIANLKERSDREKSYGIQIDALADIISFGLLPAVIGYAIITNSNMQTPVFLYLIISVMFVLTALIRLAYFNVIEIEHLNNNKKQEYFSGLPVTSVSIIIPFIFSICSVFNIPFSFVYTIMLIVISIAFIINIKIPKPRGRSLILLCLIVLPAAMYIIFIGGN